MQQCGASADTTPGNSRRSKSRPFYISNKRVLPLGFHPTEHDVVCQRGKFALEHEGNVRFRNVVKEILPKYSEAVHKWEKTAIVTSIVKQFTYENESIGFVRRIENRWYEVGEQAAREKVGQTIRDLLHDKYRSSTRAKALRKKIPITVPQNATALVVLGDLPDQRKLHGPVVDPAMGDLPDRRSLHGLRLEFKQRYAPGNKWEVSFTPHSETRPAVEELVTSASTTYCGTNAPNNEESPGHNKHGYDAMLVKPGYARGQDIVAMLKDHLSDHTNQASRSQSQERTAAPKLGTLLAGFSDRSGSEDVADSSAESIRKVPASTVVKDIASITDAAATVPDQIGKDIDAALDSLLPPPDPEALDAFSVAAFEALLDDRM